MFVDRSNSHSNFAAFLFISLFKCLFVCVVVCLFVVCLNVNVFSVCFSVCLYGYVFVCLCVCLSFCIVMCLSDYVFMCLSEWSFSFVSCWSVCYLGTVGLSVCFYVYPVFLSVHLSICCLFVSEFKAFLYTNVPMPFYTNLSQKSFCKSLLSFF